MGLSFTTQFSNGRFFWAVATMPNADETTGDQQRCKHRRHDTNAQGDGEATNGTRAKNRQGQRRDESGQVRVNNRAHGRAVTGVDGATNLMPRRSSSRIRSKTSTLASTAMPTVRIMPAMPGRLGSR